MALPLDLGRQERDHEKAAKEPTRDIPTPPTEPVLWLAPAPPLPDQRYFELALQEECEQLFSIE